MSTVEGARGSSDADTRHAIQGTTVGGGRPYRVDVPARTLNQILEEAGIERPDLLVLDIEGLELAALRGLDIDRHGPGFMLIEMLELERQLPVFEEFLEGRYATVIDRLRPQGALAGDIVHLDGRILGRHEGVTRYTIGQRRGLNVAVGDPLFVVRIDADSRQVVVGPREALLTRALNMKESNWLGGGTLQTACEGGRPVLARVRSTREPVAGRLALVDGQPGVIFDGSEEGVAPGQACVLYAPEAPSRVLGGGFIASAVRAEA